MDIRSSTGIPRLAWLAPAFLVACSSSGGGWVPIFDLGANPRGDMAARPGDDLAIAPGSDFASGPIFDLAFPQDSAIACGALGQPCCSGITCTGLSTCQGGTCLAPQVWPIADLRRGGVPQNTAVSIAGATVTAVKTAGNSHGFFVQDPNSETYGGIYVFVGGAVPTCSPGAIVTATGVFSTYHGLDELDVRTGSYQVTGQGALIQPVQTNIETLTTDNRFQSTLVYISGGFTASPVANGDQFTVAAGGYSILITSFVANDVGPSPFPAAPGQLFSTITGLGFQVGPNGGPYAPALAPRSPADLR